MKTAFLLSCLAIFTLISAQAAPAQEQQRPAAPPTPFTYQGKLVLPNGLPANGNFDFIVTVYDAATGGTATAQIEIDTVNVVDGIFTLSLPFPANRFESDESYLDVQVRAEGGTAFSQLSPRLRIGSVPLAKISETSGALSCTGCITDGQIVSIAGSKITGSVANAVNAVNATNATNAVTAQTALNAVDLTNAQTVGGNKTFTGILSGNGSGLLNVPGTLKWNVSSANSVQLQSNNGYVLTNSAGSATVTLPASPNVGDVVRVIEKGTGGFTLAMNSGQSILDWATTHQETIWTRQYTTNAFPATSVYAAIASSSDGTRLATVEYPGYLITSQNSGQTWTSPMPSDQRNYTSVAMSSDGSKMITGVEGGYLYTSTDWGVTWTPRFADAGRSWYSVAMSSDGSKLYAANNQGVYSSTNGGVSWTQRKTAVHIGYLAASADGAKLVFAENLGDVWTSTDSGATWTDRLTISPYNQWQSVASSSDGSKLVAVSDPGYLWLSSDSGVTWTQKLISPSGANTAWASVSMSSDGTRIAAAVSTLSGIYPGKVLISYDGGNSWTPTGVGTSWNAITVAGNGSRISAAMYDGVLNKLYSGPISTTMIVDTITGIKDSAVELVYIGNNQFAMVSSNGMTIPPHNY
ncbi:MAG: hypothetical protein JSS77_00910 [Acidobacteria bacterium]|nr:hypothetical protein [Acidobacteriota bacterium]